MPYFITDKSADCSGWAVVDDAGKGFGCHQTKQDAIDQAVAISIADDKPFMGERAAVGTIAVGDYVSWNVLDPEILAQVEAIQADVAVIRIFEFEDGIFSASDLLMLMNVFKLEVVPAPEMLAVAVEDDAPMAEAEPMAEEYASLNERQKSQAEDLAELVVEFGQFNQSTDGNGSHYAPADKNPFKAEGLVCSNCVFYNELTRQCQIVEGDIEPEAVCKLWVIPEGLIGSGQRDWKAAADLIVSKIDSGDVVSENRGKWLNAAWVIKATIEGGSQEARDLGKTEQRVNVADLELREDGDGMTFEGYAAVFNSDSEPLPFIERIQPGAFKRSLQSRNEIKLLWNHDAGEPLASVRGGTLKLWEDNVGLRVWARIANTTRGRDVAELIRSGTIDSMSFGFNVIKDSWSEDGNVRTLESVRIFETSLVAFPAYTATAGTVSVREQRDIDADKLADSLAALESGQSLAADQAELIKTVVDKLSEKQVVDEDNGFDQLQVKQLKMKLLAKGY